MVRSPIKKDNPSVTGWYEREQSLERPRFYLRHHYQLIGALFIGGFLGAFLWNAFMSESITRDEISNEAHVQTEQKKEQKKMTEGQTGITREESQAQVNEIRSMIDD